MVDLCNIFQYLKGRCHGNQIICERQVYTAKKTGVFCQIFPDILDLFSQSQYLSKYWTELLQLFSIGRLMYVNYKTEITFAVVEETLLW